MKLIHCADLHLDSGMRTHLSRERARSRRDELLRNFSRLAEYAADHGVKAVLIAGDLFDRDVVSELAGNTVMEVVRAHPDIHFYYLRGNHDRADVLGRGSAVPGSPPGSLPGNLFLFGPRWRTYTEGEHGGIAIAGVELTEENNAAAHASLRLDPACFNIVMLHGDLEYSRPEAAGAGRPGEGARRTGYAERISLQALRGRGIDYLALGHIHSAKTGRLDERGIYCYPGCLEGRGFDECGRHGFYLLEVDERRRLRDHRFVPFAKRTLYSVEADVTGCQSTAQMEAVVRDRIRESGCGAGDMVDLVLRGELDVDCEKDTGYLETSLAGDYFFARVSDRTLLRIDLEDYLYDESLRGEFVRQVMADGTIPQEEKNQVIRRGFAAMDGGDLL